MKTRRYPAVVKLWRDQGTCDPYLMSPATQRGHKHFHKHPARPSYTRAPKKSLSPAQYRRQHQGITTSHKNRKTIMDIKSPTE